MKHIIFSSKLAVTAWMAFFLQFNAFCQTNAGYVIDASSRESLAGVVMIDKNGKLIGYTNEYGYFSTPVQKDSISFLLAGYQKKKILFGNQPDNQVIMLIASNLILDEVIIKENYQENFENNITKLSTKEIKNYPSLMGEKDLIKVVQTLPSVKRIVEGGSGFSVRGGGADQNLVMVDNVPLYSYNHLFGLFSMFNTDAVKDVEFIKSGIPARYGGRSSSVLNVRLKDGNLEKWNGDASIGLLTSKFSFNGPLIKEKTSLLVTARRSYIDLITTPFMPANNKQLYFLEDYGAKITHILGNKSKLFGGVYFSNDRYSQKNTVVYSPTLRLYSPFQFGWKNTLSYLKYNYASERMFTNIQLYNSRYKFKYFEKTERISALKIIKLNQIDYNSYIFDSGLTIDQEINISSKLVFRAGLGVILKTFLPRSVNQTIQDGDSTLTSNISAIFPKQNIENYAYLELKSRINESMSLTSGLRLVNWNFNAFYIEPRVTLTKIFDKKHFVKLGYHKINQFVHMLSNTGGSLPTDLWITLSEKMKPLQSEQISAGYFRDIIINKKQIKIELEGYYKSMKSIVSYKQGANLLNITEGIDNENNGSSNNLDDVLVSGKGYSYGLELMARKSEGKLQGMISYTLSKSRYLFEALNNGSWFYPKFDRLHDFNINLSYPISSRISMNTAFLLSTGNPVTLPNFLYTPDQLTNNYTSKFDLEIPYYAGINNFRSDSYDRLDLGISFKKKKQRYTRIWEASIFNTFAKKNPFYYSMDRKNLDQSTVVFKPKGVPYVTILPSISYSILF